MTRVTAPPSGRPLVRAAPGALPDDGQGHPGARPPSPVTRVPQEPPA